jgi:hypothetical protein
MLNVAIIINAGVAVNAVLIAARARCYRNRRDAIILFVSVPVKSEQPGREDVADVRARIRGLDTMLGERVAEVARIKVELAAFRVRYQQQVGRLHEELDEIEAAIAQAELGEIARRMAGETAGAGASTAPPASEPPPRYTSDAVRKLFRDVAKAIHPDLAEDEVARDRRHALMIEANGAYALGDEERLRWILEAWARSPEAVQGTDPDADRLRLERRAAQLEEQIALVAGDLEALRDSPMWKLKVMVDEAAAGGKDLIRDMVARLKADIMVARNRLHAIEWTP